MIKHRSRLMYTKKVIMPIKQVIVCLVLTCSVAEHVFISTYDYRQRRAAVGGVGSAVQTYILAFSNR